MNENELMEVAIDAARRGIAAGQSPFGCAIAHQGKLVSACHNTVWLTTDITAHAEINALREACRRTEKILLEGMIVASTCEPCPMCMAALHWGRVDSVYYGATIEDATEIGFNELQVDAKMLVQQGGSQVQLFDNTLRETCQELFTIWQRHHGNSAY